MHLKFSSAKMAAILSRGEELTLPLGTNKLNEGLDIPYKYLCLTWHMIGYDTQLSLFSPWLPGYGGIAYDNSNT